MSDVKAAVEEIERSFDASRYPAGFLERYDQLECLAAGHGTETFLVRRKDTEKLFVAKRYDKGTYCAVHESSILKGLSHAACPFFRMSSRTIARFVSCANISKENRCIGS
jgi:hypothetical protein